MKIKNLKLGTLKVNSFVTEYTTDRAKTVKGGYSVWQCYTETCQGLVAHTAVC